MLHSITVFRFIASVIRMLTWRFPDERFNRRLGLLALVFNFSVFSLSLSISDIGCLFSSLSISAFSHCTPHL